MKTPQPFAITADNPKLIEAIAEELKLLGYTIKVEDSKGHALVQYSDDFSSMTKKERFYELYMQANIGKNYKYQYFVLPSQYEEALQFAKEQINHPYWKNPFDYEEGEWIYGTAGNSKYMFRFQSINGNCVSTNEYYHIFENDAYEDGCYEDAHCPNYVSVDMLKNDCHKATDEEITFILAKVAIFKGYKIDAKVKSMLDIGKVWFIETDKFYYGSQGLFMNNILIYSNGKWAEIVKTEPEIEISGHKAQFDLQNKTVKFGCKKPLDIDDLKAIARVMRINRDFNYPVCITQVGIYSEQNEFALVSLGKILKLISILEQTK
jgi:hypothetical protein